MIYGYIRVSSDKQTVENQRFEIKNYCAKENLSIDDWIEETISGTKAYNKRELGRLLSKVQKDDLIICAELSRLGRNLFMIMEISKNNNLKINKMNEQLNLFQAVNESPSPLLRVGAVMRSAFIVTHKWQEFHENGQLWIDGEIAVVPEMSKHLYKYFDGWYDTRGCDDLRNGTYFIPKGTPVCRIGVWTKYFDNGQLAWQLNYGDGTYDYKSDKKFPSFKKDGTPIVRY